MKILAVGQDEAMLDRLARELHAVGQEVQVVATPAAAQNAVVAGAFDVVVLDLAEPVREGLAWLRSLRERGHRVGVITLTVPDAVEIRIAAVDSDADDHLIHPVDARELLARCRALVRPPKVAPCEGVVSWGELSIDNRKRVVRHGAAPIDLTPREWSILEFLMEHAGTPVSKERLVRAVASRDEKLAPNAIEVYVSRLRAKLAGTGARISTLRGLGYRLEQPDEAQRARAPAEEPTGGDEFV